MTWRTDERPENTLQIGGITRVSQTHKQNGDTAHLLTFSDGRQIRVLPDGTSGQGRSRKVKAAMGSAEALTGKSVDVIATYVVGYLAETGLTWESVGNVREDTIEEWLTGWFNESEPINSRILLDDLAIDGWEIRRRE